MVLGIFTCLWSLCVAAFLPDSPMEAKCYSQEVRDAMMERVRHNETGMKTRKYEIYQVKEALTDPFVWLCTTMIMVGNLVIGGLGVFSNLIISQFGFSVLQTQLLNMAQGAFTIIIMVGAAVASQKWGQTCLVMVVGSCPVMPDCNLRWY